MQPPTVADLGERAVIRRITAHLQAPSWVVVGPGDDAAVVAPERGTLDVFTTDALVAGVHFDERFVPYSAIGYRALAVNLSDLAAMGAHPRAALLSLALPDTLPVAALDEMIGGMLALARTHAVAIVGGNVTRSPGPLVLDVTAIGAVRPRRILRRSGALPGDEVFVTGRIGNAATGLRLLRQGLTAEPGARLDADASAAVERYLRPEPRMRAGLLLGRNRAASSCIDLSDGLADAVRQVAEASGVGMSIDAAALPLGNAVRGWHEQHGGDPLETALAGGDDYELLFTSRPRQRGRLRAVCRHAGSLPITRIGVVTRDPAIRIRDEHGERAVSAGFEHFR